MTVTPLREYVLLEYVTETKTEGGIILPDGFKKKHALDGVFVRAVGPEVDSRITIGANCVTNSYSGLGFEDEGRKYILVRQQDIIGLIS
jgi:co-chaperonin GroES (HSP10)